MSNVILSEVQSYLDWLKQKIFLNSRADNAKRRMIKRGDVYWCELGKGIGSEESKKRPCVILQSDTINRYSPNTLVAPITHTSSTLSYVIQVADQFDADGNMILDGHVLLGNMVCVSKGRLRDKITTLTPDEMKKIDGAIAYVTNTFHYYETAQNIIKDREDYINRLKKKIQKLEDEITDLKK